MNDRLMIAAMACVKCGGTDIHTAYRAKGDRLDCDLLAFKEADSECLRRYCRTCGYKWTTPCADALLAAAGEKDQPITAGDVKADPNLFAAMFADKRQVAGIIARAEAAESKLAVCERERDALKRRLEPLTEEDLLAITPLWNTDETRVEYIKRVVMDSDRIRAGRVE